MCGGAAAKAPNKRINADIQQLKSTLERLFGKSPESLS
jgi:hypothetical protein